MLKPRITKGFIVIIWKTRVRSSIIQTEEKLKLCSLVLNTVSSPEKKMKTFFPPRLSSFFILILPQFNIGCLSQDSPCRRSFSMNYFLFLFSVKSKELIQEI